MVKFYEKRGNCENYTKGTKYDMNIGSLKMKSFWANEAFFQIVILVYNIFLLFKMDKVPVSEYRQWIMTFRFRSVSVKSCNQDKKLWINEVLKKTICG